MSPSLAYKALAAAAIAGVFFLPALALAATGLSIQPVKVDQTLKPGDTAQGEILITNASDTGVHVEESFDDFIPTAGAESIKFVDRAPGATSVRDWLHLDGSPSFDLGVGESKTIAYQINVPQDAEPGGHFGVVFFKASPVGPVGAGSLIVGTQVGMLVLVAIPGNHLQKGQIVKFSAPAFLQHGPVAFSIDFQNTGTVHFEPKGQIDIHNMFGQLVAQVPLSGQVVLPSSIKTLRFDWDPQGFLFGRYSATATLYDGEGDELTTDSLSFWIIPVWYSLGFVLALVLIYALIRYLKRHLKVSIH